MFEITRGSPLTRQRWRFRVRVVHGDAFGMEPDIIITLDRFSVELRASTRHKWRELDRQVYSSSMASEHPYGEPLHAADVPLPPEVVAEAFEHARQRMTIVVPLGNHEMRQARMSRSLARPAQRTFEAWK